MADGSHEVPLPDENQSPEAFVREVLRHREFEFRSHALAVLAGWKAGGIPASEWLPVVPELFYALASLQRPSWGHWNGLITAVRKAQTALRPATAGQPLDESRRTTETEQTFRWLDERIGDEFGEALAQLAVAAGGSLPGRARRRDIVLLLIRLRNRVAHDLPTDEQWWQSTAAALAVLERQLPTTAPALNPAPWMFTEQHDVWSFNGLKDNFTPIFTSLSGKVKEIPERAGEFLAEFRSLLGKSDSADQEFRQLLTRLAPDELKGVLLGEYLLGPPVGRGGFAQVHHGRQLSTGRKVALKVLHDRLGEMDRARFRHEATLLGRFNHPGIVQVFDHGDVTWKPLRQFDLSGEEWFQVLRRETAIRTYIALEWVDGRTLDTWVDPANRPAAAQVTEWFAQAAEALAVVHADGLLHRDATPRNLMVTFDGRIKLMDFGIARDQAEADLMRTRTGEVVGTPAYMSPEQLAASKATNEIGTASDVYSLCATFYEVYTGRRLYDHDRADAATVLISKLGGQRPAGPRSLGADVPWQVETLLMGGLEREPQSRPASAAELAADLRRAQRNEPTVYRRPPLRRRLLLACQRHRVLVGMAAAFLVLMSLGGLVAQTLLDHQRSKTTAAQAKADQREKERLVAEQQRQEQVVRANEQEKVAQAQARQRLFQEYANDMRAVAAHWENGRLELLRATLAKYESQEADDPRAFEWHYWRARADGLSRKLPSPRAAFRSVFLAGERLFTLDLEGIVRAWDLRTLQELYRLDDPVMNFTVSLDGRWLATADHKTVYLHRGQTGRDRREFGPAILTNALAFSDDGSLLVAGDTGANLPVWTVPAGKFLVNLSDNPRSARSPEINPRLSLDKQQGPIRSVAFSPDGRLAASGSDDGTIKIWDVKSGRYVGPNRVTHRNAVVEHTGPVSSIAFSADGRMAVSASVGAVDEFETSQAPGEIRLWNVATGEVLHTLTRFRDAVPFSGGGPPSDYRVLFSADQTKLLGCAEQGIHVWDIETGSLLETLKGAEGRFISLASGHDGTLAAIGEDSTARIWDTNGPQGRTTLIADQTDIRAIALSPDGEQLGAVCEMARPTSPPGDPATAPPADERMHRLWDSRQGRALPETPRPAWLPAHGYRRVFSPDGRWTAEIHRADSLTVRWTDTGEVRQLSASSPGGTSETSRSKSRAGKDDSARVKAPWEYEQERGDSHLEAAPISAVPQDGSALAIWYFDTTVHLWDMTTGKARVIRDHAGKPRAMAFRHDGMILAIGDAAGSVRLWDVQDGRQVQELSGHSREISGLAFSADGRRLAVAVGSPVIHSNREGEIRLWDLETASEVLRLGAGEGRIYHTVAFSPDARRLYAATSELKPPAPGRRSKDQIVYWSTQDAMPPHPGNEGAALPRLPPPPDNTPPHQPVEPRQKLVTVDEFSGAIRQICFSSSGDYVAAIDSEKLQLLETQTGHRTAALEVKANDAGSLHISDDGGLVSLVTDGTLRTWIISQSSIQTADVGTDRVLAAATPKSGASPIAVVRNDAHQISLHRSQPESVERLWEGAAFQGMVALSPDARWVAACRDALLDVVETAASGRRFSFRIEGTAEHLSFSPDGMTLAAVLGTGTGRDRRSFSISVWNLATGEDAVSWPLPVAPVRQVTGLSVSNGGERLALSAGQPLAAGNRPQATGNRPLAAGNRPSVFVRARQGDWRIAPVTVAVATSVALHPAGTQLAAGTTGRLWLMDLSLDDWPKFIRPAANQGPENRPAPGARAPRMGEKKR